jgi:hypothetical protein
MLSVVINTINWHELGVRLVTSCLPYVSLINCRSAKVGMHSALACSIR